MSEHRIAMVGTPCEIMAASKLQHYTDSPIDVKLGLFCMENFSYKYFVNLLKEYDLKMDDIEKFQIEKGFVSLLLKTKQTVKIPLSVAKRIIRKNCNIWRSITYIIILFLSYWRWKICSSCKKEKIKHRNKLDWFVLELCFRKGEIKYESNF